MPGGTFHAAGRFALSHREFLSDMIAIGGGERRVLKANHDPKWLTIGMVGKGTENSPGRSYGYSSDSIVMGDDLTIGTLVLSVL